MYSVSRYLLPLSFLYTLTHATCNLLESDKASYIDTESSTSILTMCGHDQSSLSLWEQYHCEFIQNRDGYQKCWPQRRMSNCAPGNLKGAIFLYHGYSACPDQYNDLAPKLQDECFHVYQILTLGHGYTPCNSSQCIVGRWNLTAMPIKRQPYIDYIQRMIEVITDEVSIIKECEAAANSAFTSENLEVVVGGLSFGAPLAAATVAFSGSNALFTKQIVMSPFFGITSSAADNLGYKCSLNNAAFEECLSLYFQGIGLGINDTQSVAMSNMVLAALSSFVDVEFLDASFETLNVLVRKILVWIVENADVIGNEETKQKIQQVLLGIIQWGEQCWKDVDVRDRGGWCDFELHHLLAAHSFANYLVDSLYDNERDISVETLIILVERDGPTRNSLITDYINKYYNHNDDVISNTVSCCMWLIALKCQLSNYEGEIDNACGVPHSSMSEPDNLGIYPYDLYWEEWYHSGIIAFINGETFDDAHFMSTKQWDTTSEQCVSLDLTDPPSSLIADVPSVLSIAVGITEGQLTDTAKVAVLDGLSELLGVERGVLELTFSLIGSSTNAGSDQIEDLFEFLVEIDPYSARLLIALLDMSALREIANFPIVHAEIDGKQYDLDYDATTLSPTNGSNGNWFALWIVIDWFILIFVV